MSCSSSGTINQLLPDVTDWTGTEVRLNGAASAGDTTINLDGFLTSGGTIYKGSTFRFGASTGDYQTYEVTADIAKVGTTVTGLQIYPGLKIDHPDDRIIEDLSDGIRKLVDVRTTVRKYWNYRQGVGYAFYGTGGPTDVQGYPLIRDFGVGYFEARDRLQIEFVYEWQGISERLALQLYQTYTKFAARRIERETNEDGTPYTHTIPYYIEPYNPSQGILTPRTWTGPVYKTKEEALLEARPTITQSGSGQYTLQYVVIEGAYRSPWYSTFGDTGATLTDDFQTRMPDWYELQGLL